MASPLLVAPMRIIVSLIPPAQARPLIPAAPHTARSHLVGISVDGSTSSRPLPLQHGTKSAVQGNGLTWTTFFRGRLAVSESESDEEALAHLLLAIC